MRQSSYTVHLSLVPIRPTLTRWEQSPSAISHGAEVISRRADLGAANKATGQVGRFLKSAAMRAINNLNKINKIV